MKSRTHDPARSGSTRRTPRRALLAGSLFFLFAAGPAHANDEPAMALDVSACSEGTRARLEWLVERLESRELYADIWWKGWLGVYSTGVVLQSARAAIKEDSGKRADLVVSAVKAAIGVTRLIFSRPTARLGADPLQVAALPDERACLERVAQGEELLDKAAKESQRRWNWKPHAANVALNLVGAVIVTQAFNGGKGWESMGVGIAVGEAMILSHPWKGKSDLEEYQATFSPSVPQTSWSIQPYHAGLLLNVRF